MTSGEGGGSWQIKYSYFELPLNTYYYLDTMPSDIVQTLPNSLHVLILKYF